MAIFNPVIPLTEAAKAIGRLLGANESFASIGRAIERNSSYIRQIFVGKKSGAHVAPALEDLSRGGRPTPPPRRTTKSGARALTRAKADKTASRAVSGRADFVKKLEAAAQRGDYVRVRTQWQKAEAAYSAGKKSTSPGVKQDLGLLGKNNVTSIFGKDPGFGASIRAADLLKQFREFEAKHPKLKGQKLLAAFAEKGANVKTIRAYGGTYSQKVSGFVNIKLQFFSGGSDQPPTGKRNR